MKVGKSVNRLVLGDHDDHVLLPGRLYVWLPRNRLGSDDVIRKEAFLDEFLQVSSEGPAVHSLVPFTVVVGAILL